MDEFKKLLRPLLLKLWAERFINRLIAVGIVTTGLGILTVLLSWFRVSLDFSVIALILIAVTFLIAVLLSCYKAPNYDHAAKAGDALGLAERLITAWELLRDRKTNSEMEKLAVADGLEKAKTETLAKRYIMKFPKKQLIVCCVLMSAFFIMGAVGSPRSKEAEHYEKVQAEKITLAESNVKKAKKPTPKTKEFQKETSTLKRELRKARTKTEGEKTVQNAQQKLKKLEKNSINQDLKAIAAAMNNQGAMEAIKKAAENKNEDEIKEAAKAVSKELQSLSEEEKKKLMDTLASLIDDKSVESLQSLLSALAAKDEAATTAAANALAGQLGKLASENAELREAISELNERMASGQSQEQAEGEQSEESEGKGEGKGQGEGQGEGQGAGEGQGKGEGQPQSMGQGQGQSQGRGEGHIENEEIYTRKAQDVQGYKTEVKGSNNADGSSQHSQKRGTGTDGEILPYGEVLDIYRQEAFNDMENQSVPVGMQNLVSEYFSTLEK